MVVLAHVAELYRFRALIATLVLRELRARYRGSVFGFLWSFLNPLLLMLVYVLVFAVYLRVPMDNYAVFLFTGLLPWLWFSSSLGHAAGVIVGSGGLVKRIMFPAEVLPLVSVLSNLANLLLSLPLLFVFLWIFGVRPGPMLAFLPLLLALQLLLTVGLALPLAALNVHLRDVEQILANGLVLLFFFSPILYPYTTVPHTLRLGDVVTVPLRPLYFLNPVAGLVQSYQNVIFFGREPHWIHLGMVTISALVALWAGYWLFDRLRDSLAEEV
jgi:lipopolysaccharide transport system permease protein